MATIRSVTPVNVKTELARATDGDVINFLPGDYGLIDIRSRKFNSAPLTLNLGSAQLSLSVNFSSGLVVNGGVYLGKWDAYGRGSYIRNSQRLQLVGGTYLDANRGLVLQAVDDFQVLKTKIQRMGTDGINVAGCHRGLIDGATISDFAPISGAHPDGIQLWSLPGFVPTSDITVQNVAVSGRTQGVTMFDGERIGLDRIYLKRITTDVTYGQGIAVYNVRSGEVSDCRVTTHALAAPGSRSMLNIVNSPNVVRLNNYVGPKHP